MRWNVIVLLFLAVMLGMTGCAGKKYVYKSDVGRACYYACSAENSRCLMPCNQYCYNNLGCSMNNLSCSLGCKSYIESCLAACPDLEEAAN